MDLFQNLSDDQIALLGCFSALLLAATTMFFSFYLGQYRQKNQHQTDRQQHRHPFSTNRSSQLDEQQDQAA